MLQKNVSGGKAPPHPPVLIPVCLLRDVQQRGLSRPVFLSESDQWDAVLCALVIDLDFDGQKEVLLGTYGQVPPPRSRCTFTSANHQVPLGDGDAHSSL